jgi:DNA-binding CsgD family transcriptional regulator
VPYEVLTIQQSDMITMLINGENITDIAKKLNVNRNTVYNWMKKDNIRAEIDRRKQELTNQGNQLIMKDLTTYIGNIKDLANDKSDKRVCLAANQYLINRIYGNPTNTLEVTTEENSDNLTETELEQELSKFKKLSLVK